MSSVTSVQQKQSTTAAPIEIQLCLIGSGNVGKSILTIQFVHNMFLEEYDPMIEQRFRKAFIVDEQIYLLDFVEIDVSEEHSAMRDYFIRSSLGFLLVFAVNDRRSFAVIPDLVLRILQVKEQQSYPILMVGNKTDLVDERIIDSEEARAMARDLGIEYVECTAKKSVDHVFRPIISSVKNYKSSVDDRRNRKCKMM